MRTEEGGVPTGWEKTTLGETFKWGSGGTPNRSNTSYFGGAIPWVIIGDLTDGPVWDTQSTITEEGLRNSAARWVEPGSVLLAMYGSIGKLGIAKIPLTTNQAIAYTKTDPVLPEYLFWYLFAHRDQLAALGKGGTQKNISQEVIKSFPFLLAPLPEQRRIVDEVERQTTRLQNAEASLRRVREELKRYRSAVLKMACEGRLVPTEAELAQGEGRGYDTKGSSIKGLRRSDLQHLPEGWTWTTVEDLAKKHQGSICAGPFGTIFKARDFRPAGVPIIFLRHVKPGSYATAKPTFMDADKWRELFEPYSVRGGELLITKLGDPPGAAAVYPDGRGPAMLTPDVIKMDVDNGKALTRFMMHYFNSPVAQRFAFGAAFGTTRPRLTLPIFRSIPVPLPPIEEQVRIVGEIDRRLSILEQLEACATSNLARVNTLKLAILKKAFSGDLTQQNYEDEPASVLLKRICESRQEQVRALSRPRRGRGVEPGTSVPGPDAKTKPKTPRGGDSVYDSPFAPSGLPKELETPSLGLKPQALRLGPFGAEDFVLEDSFDSQDDERTSTDNDDEDFLSLPRDEQIDLVWDALFGLGAMPQDEAVRTAALYLRDEERARFQRLRTMGSLYGAILSAIKRGIREGSFDRPTRGSVRAVLTDPRDYSGDIWRECFLETLTDEAVPEADALRAAAEWAREYMGLQFVRLREDGVILRGLRAALKREIRLGEIMRRRGMLFPPSEDPPEGKE